MLVGVATLLIRNLTGYVEGMMFAIVMGGALVFVCAVSNLLVSLLRKATARVGPPGRQPTRRRTGGSERGVLFRSARRSRRGTRKRHEGAWKRGQKRTL